MTIARLDQMQANSPRWVSLGDCASPAEKAALAKFRDLLPEDGITRAWANLTFIDQRGRTAEIDVLLVTKVGFFVVELKGWHGTITGSQQTWTVTGSHGGVRRWANPLVLADSKAKRLSSFLKGYLTGQQHLPFLGAIVVMHGQDSSVSLDANAMDNVYALDGYNVGGALKAKLFSAFLKDLPDNPHHEIDGLKAHVIGLAAQAADFKPTPKTRFIGQFSLEEADPVGDGPTWQDFIAVHPSAKNVRRRVRIFDFPQNASSEERQQIRQSAQREFQLTDNIQHPGVTGPTEFFETDSGPALVFRHDDSVSLDEFLTARGGSLSLEDRLALIRKLAEVLRYAHDRRLVHRGLSPRQVYVLTSGESVEVSVRDWFTGRLSGGSSHATSVPSQTVISGGATDFRGLTAAESWIYLAPEAHHSVENLPGIPLDVYGLGALSYLILTGQAPAANLSELQLKLEQQGGLDPATVTESLPPSFAQVVLNATSAAEPERTASVDEFLAALDDAWEVETSADQPEKAQPTADPLDAVVGQIIGERFEVRGRRGSGSTGTALVVVDYDTDEKPVILKLARNDGATTRLEREAEVLATLNHPRVVRLLDRPVVVDGRTGLLLSDAGKTTLAERITREGRLTIEQLETYGTDLLEAVAHLDDRGVFHRDIKPANLGIAPDPGTRKPRLTLFDLSLSTEPLDRIGSGSTGYLDPFLGRGKRHQFDRAAELYAVAVTLFEMATGQLPWWHDGVTGPSTSTDHVVVAPTSFEEQVAPSLVAFFTQAFAPIAADRFPDVRAVAAAWSRVFAALNPASAVDDADAEAAREELAAQASLDTILAASGLSPRALSGLEKVPATTVGELLGTSPVVLNSLPGLGEKHRKEIQRRVRQWRNGLLDDAPVPGPSAVGARGVESVVESLTRTPTPRSSAKTVAENFLASAVLGVTANPADESGWPTTAQLSATLGVERAELTKTMTTLAAWWGKSEVLSEVSAELEEIVHAQGRVMTLTEAATALMVRRGSVLDGVARHRRAAGLVRAIVEADAQRDEPRFQTRRAEVMLIALTRASDPLASGERYPTPESLLDAARTLGQGATDLVSSGQIVSASIARTTLRDVPGPGIDFSDDRLLRLAAAAAPSIAQSSFGELYPVDIDVAAAAHVALRGWSAASVPEEAIRRRVSGRFPALGALPPRPALDAIVEDALPGFSFDQGNYQRHDSTRGTAYSTHSQTNLQGQRGSEIDRLLRDSLRRRSGSTLAIVPRRYDLAQRILSDVYGVRRVDVAELVVNSVKTIAAAQRVSWDVVLRADAEPRTGAEWHNLTGLVHDAVRDPWETLVASDKPLLLTNLGPLVRYGLSRYLSDLLDLSRPRPAARWLLVSRLSSSPVPTLEGQSVPVGPDKWIDLPPDMQLITDLGASSFATPPSPLGASS